MTARSARMWADGDAYEAYIGRWSRLVAREFLIWLALPKRQRWLDVGCGTGALTQTVLTSAEPEAIKGIDPSPAYLALVQANITDSRANFALGAAESLPEPPAAYDVAVSGLVLNFVPDPADALREMTRVVRPGGCVALYVWDYAGRMDLLRHFWDAAVALDPEASAIDEGNLFPICNPAALTDYFANAGLTAIKTRAIDVPVVLRDFEDFWSPFLGGQGPAPSYVVRLRSTDRDRLKQRLQAMLPLQPDGSIRLIARAWAVRGVV